MISPGVLQDRAIVGTRYQLQWSPGSILGGDGFVSIALYKFGEFQVSLADMAPNLGTFEWQAPDLVGDGYTIHIRSHADPDTIGENDVPFTIGKPSNAVEPGAWMSYE